LLLLLHVVAEFEGENYHFDLEVGNKGQPFSLLAVLLNSQQYLQDVPFVLKHRLNVLLLGIVG
jgi:hypothetical protein